MSDFLKCECLHCGQPIEYPSEGNGQMISCPTCEKPVTLTPVNSAASVTRKPKEQKRSRTNLSKLTEETIRAKTQAGDTPLHRAAKNGQFDLIPNHILNIDLFKIQNNNGLTCLHVAAKYGTLHQIPRQFLTKETLTISSGAWVTGSGYQAHGDTVLHTAAISGHADQIPKEFLIPELLLIEATGYRQTVLEHLVRSQRLDLLPENYAKSELWNVKDRNGQTPREILEILIERGADSKQRLAESQAKLESVRAELATEKQKEKLRFFGYALEERMTKGEASDALDECAKQFPQKDAEYYNRPATEEQLTKLREINTQCETDEPFYDFEEEVALTYGKAKDLIQEWGWLERQNEREQENAYLKSDESKIDEMWMRIEDDREVTREQVAKAYAVVKSRIADKTQTPDQTEIEDTLEELFAELRNDGKSFPVYRCTACAAMFKARPEGVGAVNFSSGVFSTKEDIVPVIMPCPSCGRDNRVGTLKVCKYICPSCSKGCLVAKSQTGHSVKHFSSECMKEFFASPSETLNARLTIRLMQYVD